MSRTPAKSWQCPYCLHFSVISKEVYGQGHVTCLSSKHGPTRLIATYFACPNSNCRELTLYAGLWPYQVRGGGTEEYGPVIQEWPLLPESMAKPQPDYIPEQIRGDYREACLIRDRSPKASATLARRCLQGMITHFWKVKKRTLAKQIDAIRARVDGHTWKAIDAVRKVGNIGAHMEKDVDLIVDVDPKEAGLLIGLIERLFKEWYVAKHDREASMTALIALAEGKEKARKGQAGAAEDSDQATKAS